MMILGVDTGMTNVGWSIVEKKDGEFELIDCGLWSPKSGYKTINAQIIDKMRVLSADVEKTVKDFEITHIAVELVPNLRMGQRDKVVATENLMRMTAIYHKVDYLEISARTVKKQLTGNGSASKEEMKAECLRRYPEMKSDLRFDTYDAVAIATVAGDVAENKWWEALK